jgi:O-antigen/teichoic acid export membrane protein
VSLLTVLGAQKENAALALGSLALLAVANIVVAPLYGVLGASVAVAIATLAWLIASALVLASFGGLRTDAFYLLSAR